LRRPGEVSLERALSKLGLASRTEARALIQDGRVRVDGRPADDPLAPVVELTEGKNREIRRMLGVAGHEVTRLKRVSFEGLELGGLEPGQWRVVAPEEIRAAFPRGSR